MSGRNSTRINRVSNGQSGQIEKEGSQNTKINLKLVNAGRMILNTFKFQIDKPPLSQPLHANLVPKHKHYQAQHKFSQSPQLMPSMFPQMVQGKSIPLASYSSSREGNILVQQSNKTHFQQSKMENKYSTKQRDDEKTKEEQKQIVTLADYLRVQVNNIPPFKQPDDTIQKLPERSSRVELKGDIDRMIKQQLKNESNQEEPPNKESKDNQIAFQKEIQSKKSEQCIANSKTQGDCFENSDDVIQVKCDNVMQEYRDHREEKMTHSPDGVIFSSDGVMYSGDNEEEFFGLKKTVELNLSDCIDELKSKNSLLSFDLRDCDLEEIRSDPNYEALLLNICAYLESRQVGVENHPNNQREKPDLQEELERARVLQYFVFNGVEDSLFSRGVRVDLIRCLIPQIQNYPESLVCAFACRIENNFFQIEDELKLREIFSLLLHYLHSHDYHSNILLKSILKFIRMKSLRLSLIEFLLQYHSSIDFIHNTNALSLLLTLQKYNSLPPQLQQILMQNA